MKLNFLKNSRVIIFAFCFSLVCFISVFIVNIVFETNIVPKGGIPEATNGVDFESLYTGGVSSISGGITSRKVVAAFTGQQSDVTADSLIPIMKITVHGTKKEITSTIYKDTDKGYIYILCPDGSFRKANLSSLRKLLINKNNEEIFNVSEPGTITIDGRKIYPSEYNISAETLFESVSMNRKKSDSDLTRVIVSEEKNPVITGINPNSELMIYEDDEKVFSGTVEDNNNGLYRPEKNGVFKYVVNTNLKAGYVNYEFLVEYDCFPDFKISSLSKPQGDVFVISVINTHSKPVTAYASFDYSATFMERENSAWCYIPISHTISAGTYSITVTCGDYSEDWSVNITSGDFSVQYLEMSEQTISNTYTDTSRSEYNSMMESTYTVFDEKTYWSGVFIKPVSGTLTTEYGIYRYTNGSNNASRHAGLDIAADEGTVIIAPAAGKVLFSGYLQLTGNTVVLDHGNGLKSYFLHMNDTACVKGDILNQGDSIGTVGSTGYATGPHLHYQLMIGNFSINPNKAFDGTIGFYDSYTLGLIKP